MTPTEIEHAREAWKVDPKSCVVLGEKDYRYALVWAERVESWRWAPVSGRSYSFTWPDPEEVPMLTRDALHRRLLELGAFVQPAAGNGYLVYNQTNQGSIAWSPDSLIIAMARGIIALAKENP